MPTTLLLLESGTVRILCDAMTAGQIGHSGFLARTATRSPSPAAQVSCPNRSLSFELSPLQMGVTSFQGVRFVAAVPEPT